MERKGKHTARMASTPPLTCDLSKDFPVLSRRIVRYANRDVSRIDFMCEISKMLIDFSGCDAVELRTEHGNLYYCCEVKVRPTESFRFETRTINRQGRAASAAQRESDIERLCEYVLRGVYSASPPFFTNNGSFCTGDSGTAVEIRFDSGEHALTEKITPGGDYGSLAIIPFVVDEENYGLLILKSGRKYFLTEKEVEFYEGVAQTLGAGVSCLRAQFALRERVKELTCLYSIAKVVEQPGLSRDEILARIVEILPRAWQYPEIAFARMKVDGVVFTSRDFKDGKHKMSSGIFVNDQQRGVVEMVYAGEGLAFEEDPFLSEERSLLDAVAREVEVILEVKQAEEEKSRLQDQLRHADRLATIGQFAAGIAHELNEPLGKMLGFAQLAGKCEGLPEQAARDLEKIVGASLNARETVKKLLIFTRQMPRKKTRVDLNKIITEELSFFESQCRKEKIALVRSLQPDLPLIDGDPAQLNQVLVNLVVNAIQAMPEGGTLAISTSGGKETARLVVEDTGVGMSEEVQKKIFIPFFTTKGVGKGTGLGLSVVHGIVTSHGGAIKVTSRSSHGSRFEVSFPAAKQQDTQEDAQNGERG